MSGATQTRARTETAPPAADGLTTYDEYRETRYFASLDGVRAVAILLVFTAHIGFHDMWRFFYGGNGVTVFFVLSGFIITTLALREEARRGKFSLQSFYIRRVFRIYPIYFAVLAFYCALIYGVGFTPERRGIFSEQLPYYVFGFPEYHFFNFQLAADGAAPFSGAWSIGIEEKFYLLWPLVGFVFFRGSFKSRLIACAVALAGCILGRLLWSNGQYVFEYVFIVLGVVLALLLHNRHWFDRLRGLGRRDVVLALFAVFVVFQIVIAVAFDEDSDTLRLVQGVFVAAALGGIVLSRGSETAWLSSRPMVFLGRVSYVFYLTHNFVLNAVEKTPLGRHGVIWSLADVAVALPLAVLVAWIGHVTIEKPFIRIGHRLAHRGDKPFHAV